MQKELRLLFTVKEAAVALALSLAKVYELTQSGELPTVRVGRSVRIRREDLQAFIEQRLST